MYYGPFGVEKTRSPTGFVMSELTSLQFPALSTETGKYAKQPSG